MNSETWKKVAEIAAFGLGAAFVTAAVTAKLKKADSVYDNDPKEKNPLEGKKVVFVENENEPENADGVKGHLEVVGKSEHKAGFYEKYIKRGVDVVLSFGGLVALSPILGGIAIAIKAEDPGPVFFTQKRVGKNKEYFKLHKFRSMKMSTPHDKPTHMLENPEQYITRVGKFLRSHSLDELPQIWDIFVGNMSIIGPRPGLWNQDKLTAERDKYGANDVKPGLTGWAQINGRDELEIEEKARLDGEYVAQMGPGMDFQLVKQQPKLVRCVSGHVYDVIVDLRPDSPTFGQWRGFHLTGENMDSLYVPAYFGHGYLVIEDSIVSYKAGEVFYGEGDSGIMYNDPDIGIDWPFELIGGNENMIISDKDKKLMSLKEYIQIV